MTGRHVMSHERAQTAAKMDAFLIDRRAPITCVPNRPMKPVYRERAAAGLAPELARPPLRAESQRSIRNVT
jgi:hypothetical protein